MNFVDYIKPELLILIPVMYLIGEAIKRSRIADRFIPLILGGVAILLCGAWVVATSTFEGPADYALGIFTALTQGVFVAGTSVYVNQIVKQTRKDD